MRVIYFLICVRKHESNLPTNTVYHITSHLTKQAFLGPITKLVAKLVAHHKTSRIKDI